MNEKVKELTNERDRKAELTLVRLLEDMQTRQERRHFCRLMNVEWGEYQHLRRKYSRILAEYCRSKGKEFVLDDD